MDIQDNSWSLEEMNYTRAVSCCSCSQAGGHTMPSSGTAVCDGQLDYMHVYRIVNRDINVYNTWLVGSN